MRKEKFLFSSNPSWIGSYGKFHLPVRLWSQQGLESGIWSYTEKIQLCSSVTLVPKQRSCTIFYFLAHFFPRTDPVCLQLWVRNLRWQHHTMVKLIGYTSYPLQTTKPNPNSSLQANLRECYHLSLQKVVWWADAIINEVKGKSRHSAFLFWPWLPLIYPWGITISGCGSLLITVSEHRAHSRQNNLFSLMTY